MMIDEHLRSYREPQLALSEKPTGAFSWRPQQATMEGIEGVQLAGEGPDVEEN